MISGSISRPASGCAFTDDGDRPCSLASKIVSEWNFAQERFVASCRERARGNQKILVIQKRLLDILVVIATIFVVG